MKMYLKPTQAILWTLISASLLLGFVSCNKVEVVVPTLDNAFSILNSELIEETLPKVSGKESNQPVISNIQGNGSVLAGGTNLLTLEFEDPQDDITHVLISMDGEDGYYRMAIPANSTSISLTMLLEQDLIQNALSLYFNLIDDKAHVSEPYEVPVNRVEAGTGNLQVSLSWPIDNDVDLHLVQPDGQEIYYGNEGSTNGGLLDIDSNAGCWIDGVRNENITFGEGAVVLAGEYIVRVDFYEECIIGGAKTNFSAIAYLQGQRIAATSGNNPASGSFDTGTYTLGGEGDGVEIMRFTVPMEIGKKDIVTIDYSYTARKRKSANNPKMQ